VWDKRLEFDGSNRYCMVTVDGTDFRIFEPTPFSPMWYSHKFKGPGVRYEVALSINGGDIVHIHGPFACGAWPDISLFRDRLAHMLLPGEMVEADRGYRGEREKIRIPVDYQSVEEKRQKSRARACQETCNKRFKQFQCLQQRFRHEISKHQECFEAVVVITQLSIQHGESLFGVPFS
jgi:hypothetical protein